MMEFVAESMFNITLSMSTIILVMLLFSRIISKKLTAQCRYLLWCLIILRLAVPVAGLHFMTPIFTITIPETVTYEENPNDGIRENDLHSYDRMPTSETQNILEWQEIGDEPVISYPPQSPSESLTEKMVPDTERFSEREKNQTALESSLPNVDDPIQSPMTIDITRILRGVMLIWMTVAVGNFAFAWHPIFALSFA